MAIAPNEVKDYSPFLEEYKRFSPKFLRQRLKEKIVGGRSIENDSHDVYVSLLFADISGFTQLSSRLNAEELKNHINDYFTKLLSIIHEHHGDVVKFCGDAVLIMWPLHPHCNEEMKEAAVLMSCLCALQLLEDCGEYLRKRDGSRLSVGVEYDEASLVKLSLHCGISCGVAKWMILEDKQLSEFVLIGKVLHEMGEAESVAKAGEVYIHHNAYHAIKGKLDAHPMISADGNITMISSIDGQSNVYRLSGALNIDYANKRHFLRKSTAMEPLVQSDSPEEAAAEVGGAMAMSKDQNDEHESVKKTAHRRFHRHLDSMKASFFKAKQTSSSSLLSPSIKNQSTVPIMRHSTTSDASAADGYAVTFEAPSCSYDESMHLFHHPKDHDVQQLNYIRPFPSIHDNSGIQRHSTTDISHFLQQSSTTAATKRAGMLLPTGTSTIHESSSVSANLIKWRDNKVTHGMAKCRRNGSTASALVQLLPSSMSNALFGGNNQQTPSQSSAVSAVASASEDELLLQQSGTKIKKLSVRVLKIKLRYDSDEHIQAVINHLSSWNSNKSSELPSPAGAGMNVSIDEAMGFSPARPSYSTTAAVTAAAVIGAANNKNDVSIQFNSVALSKRILLAAELRRYVHTTAARAIESNTVKFLSEMRDVATVFIQLLDLDVSFTTGDRKLPQQVFGIVCNEMNNAGGSLRQFVVDDKGCVMIVCFGLFGSSNQNNCVQAVEFALNTKELLQTVNCRSVYGITLGSVYCGLVGANTRCEYAVMGSSVNLAARLMAACIKSMTPTVASQSAGTGGTEVTVFNPQSFLVDAAVHEKTITSFQYVRTSSIRAKGYSEPVAVFAPIRRVKACRSVLIRDTLNRQQSSFLKLEHGTYDRKALMNEDLRADLIQTEAKGYHVDQGEAHGIKSETAAPLGQHNDEAMRCRSRSVHCVPSMHERDVQLHKVVRKLACSKSYAILICGEEGIGKSLFLSNLLGRVTEQRQYHHARTAIVQHRCTPLNRYVPYHTISELLMHIFDIGESFPVAPSSATIGCKRNLHTVSARQQHREAVVFTSVQSSHLRDLLHFHSNGAAASAGGVNRTGDAMVHTLNRVVEEEIVTMTQSEEELQHDPSIVIRCGCSDEGNDATPILNYSPFVQNDCNRLERSTETSTFALSIDVTESCNSTSNECASPIACENHILHRRKSRMRLNSSSECLHGRSPRYQRRLQPLLQRKATPHLQQLVHETKEMSSESKRPEYGEDPLLVSASVPLQSTETTVASSASIADSTEAIVVKWLQRYIPSTMTMQHALKYTTLSDAEAKHDGSSTVNLLDKYVQLKPTSHLNRGDVSKLILSQPLHCFSALLNCVLGTTLSFEDDRDLSQDFPAAQQQQLSFPSAVELLTGEGQRLLLDTLLITIFLIAVRAPLLHKLTLTAADAFNSTDAKPLQWIVAVDDLQHADANSLILWCRLSSLLKVSVSEAVDEEVSKILPTNELDTWSLTSIRSSDTSAADPVKIIQRGHLIGTITTFAPIAASQRVALLSSYVHHMECDDGMLSHEDLYEVLRLISNEHSILLSKLSLEGVCSLFTEVLGLQQWLWLMSNAALAVHGLSNDGEDTRSAPHAVLNVEKDIKKGMSNQYDSKQAALPSGRRKGIRVNYHALALLTGRHDQAVRSPLSSSSAPEDIFNSVTNRRNSRNSSHKHQEQLQRECLNPLYLLSRSGLPSATIEFANAVKDAIEMQCFRGFQHLPLIKKRHKMILEVLDGLSATEVAVLKSASVIGKVFQLHELISTLLDLDLFRHEQLGNDVALHRLLSSLCSCGILRQLSSHGVEEGIQVQSYTFAEETTRITIYNLMLDSQRKHAHAVIALSLEKSLEMSKRSYSKLEILQQINYHYQLSDNLPRRIAMLLKSVQFARAHRDTNATIWYCTELLQVILSMSEDELLVNCKQSEVEFVLILYEQLQQQLHQKQLLHTSSKNSRASLQQQRMTSYSKWPRFMKRKSKLFNNRVASVDCELPPIRAPFQTLKNPNDAIDWNCHATTGNKAAVELQLHNFTFAELIILRRKLMQRLIDATSDCMDAVNMFNILPDAKIEWWFVEEVRRKCSLCGITMTDIIHWCGIIAEQYHECNQWTVSASYAALCNHLHFHFEVTSCKETLQQWEASSHFLHRRSTFGEHKSQKSLTTILPNFNWRMNAAETCHHHLSLHRCSSIYTTRDLHNISAFSIAREFGNYDAASATATVKVAANTRGSMATVRHWTVRKASSFLQPFMVRRCNPASSSSYSNVDCDVQLQDSNQLKANESWSSNIIRSNTIVSSVLDLIATRNSLQQRETGEHHFCVVKALNIMRVNLLLAQQFLLAGCALAAVEVLDTCHCDTNTIDSKWTKQQIRDMTLCCSKVDCIFSLAYRSLGDHQQSVKHATQLTDVPDSQAMGYILYSKAQHLASSGRLYLALQYLQHAFIISERCGDDQLLQQVALLCAWAWLFLGQRSSAISMIGLCFAAFERSFTTELSESRQHQHDNHHHPQQKHVPTLHRLCELQELCFFLPPEVSDNAGHKALQNIANVSGLRSPPSEVSLPDAEVHQHRMLSLSLFASVRQVHMLVLASPGTSDGTRSVVDIAPFDAQHVPERSSTSISAVQNSSTILNLELREYAAAMTYACDGFQSDDNDSSLLRKTSHQITFLPEGFHFFLLIDSACKALLVYIIEAIVKQQHSHMQSRVDDVYEMMELIEKCLQLFKQCVDNNLIGLTPLYYALCVRHDMIIILLKAMGWNDVAAFALMTIRLTLEEGIGAASTSFSISSIEVWHQLEGLRQWLQYALVQRKKTKSVDPYSSIWMNDFEDLVSLHNCTESIAEDDGGSDDFIDDGIEGDDVEDETDPDTVAELSPYQIVAHDDDAETVSLASLLNKQGSQLSSNAAAATAAALLRDSKSISNDEPYPQDRGIILDQRHHARVKRKPLPTRQHQQVVGSESSATPALIGCSTKIFPLAKFFLRELLSELHVLQAKLKVVMKKEDVVESALQTN